MSSTIRMNTHTRSSATSGLALRNADVAQRRSGAGQPARRSGAGVLEAALDGAAVEIGDLAPAGGAAGSEPAREDAEAGAAAEAVPAWPDSNSTFMNGAIKP